MYDDKNLRCRLKWKKKKKILSQQVWFNVLIITQQLKKWF